MTRFRARLYACFALVYLVWGSSFLVARVGVSHLPPLLFTSLRSLIGGTLLLCLALYRGDRLPNTAREWQQIFFFSLVLIALSSGSSTFALKYIPSNEVALLNASMALWIAGLGTLGPKGQPLSVPSLLGLLLGFGGVALLVWPQEMRLTPHVGWQLLVLAAACVWASGTIVYRNTTLLIGPIAFNAMIMLSGGVVLGTAGIASGELPEWHWEWRGMLAIVFLAVFASALTYTAFTWLMKNARTDRVATFAYVNPAIATVLGWVVLGETLTPQQVLGMLVVLAGVVLVTLPSRHS
jgi:drug/metabolite transporter (DMT)-like permease